jgi:hypothetical protein
MTTDLEELTSIADQCNKHGTRNSQRGSKVGALCGAVPDYNRIAAGQARSLHARHLPISLPHISIQDGNNE